MTSYKELDRNGLFDDCTKDILQELQQEDDIDSVKGARTLKLTLTLVKELFSRVLNFTRIFFAGL